MDPRSGQEDLGHDDDRKWIETFKEKPVGIHPPELIRLLNRMRAEPIEGKHCLIIDKPHEQWVIAEMQGRGLPPTLLNIRVKNCKDGEWEIFKLRWQRYTGKAL